jgi:uroporphyrinogen decarboxylase
MDFISLPVGGTQLLNYQYRQFESSDIQKALQSDLFVVTVVDGPFQRLVNKKGLLYVIAECTRDIVKTAVAINGEAREAERLINECIDHGANAVVIADDLAYNAGMFITQNAFDDAICCHYRAFTERIHHRGAYAVFHSCGNITNIISGIVSAGFDGLSCESECADILSIKSNYGTHLTLFAGISTELLVDYPSSAEDEERFTELVSKLGDDGGFILSSSSGLYSSHMFYNIQRLYTRADKISRSTADGR